MATPSTEAKRSFRIDEFAARNSVSRSQVYIEIREGRLNARKVGSATLITTEDETAWLASLPQARATARERAA
ncbi:DNA-binding protein [Bradyrhizobium sp. 18BD]